MGHRRTQIGWIVLVVALVLSLPAAGAEKKTAPAKTASPQDKAAPVELAVADIIPDGERSLRQLRKIRDQFGADTSESAIESAVPAFRQQLEQWWKNNAAVLGQSRSQQRINDVMWEWRQQESQITTWTTLLAAQFNELETQANKIDKLVLIWQATQTALSKRTVPEPALGKIAEVLREAAATQRLLEEQTARLVAVQSQLAAQLESLQDIRQEIDRVQTQAQRNLLVRESPPLWRAFTGADATTAIAAWTSEAASKLYEDGRNFLQFYTARLFFHLAVFLAMLVLFLHLKRLARTTSAIALRDSESFILRHTYASAVLLAFLLVPLFYAGASAQIVRIAVIPTIIPLLCLLPVVVGSRFLPGLYCYAIIQVLDFLHYYLPAQWLLVRLLVLLVGLLGAMGAGMLITAQQRDPATLSILGARALSVLLGLGLVLFLGSTCANVLGNISLAELLISVPIRLVYAGILARVTSAVLITFTVLGLHTPLARTLRSVQRQGARVASGLRRLVHGLAASAWLVLSLYIIGVLEDVLSAGHEFLDMRWRIGAAEISVQGIMDFCVVFFAAYMLSRLLRVLLAQEIFPRIRMRRGVPDALELLCRYGVLFMGFLLALTSAGVNLSQVTLAMSALGVGIGFGLQNIVNNFVSGLILVFEHPIQVGDFVEVGPHYGRVSKIGFRASWVRTMDGAEVVIPNAELIGTKVINWSLSDRRRRIAIQVPVPIDTDPDRVIATLKDVAGSHPEVREEPPPAAIFEQFGESALKFTLHCWTRVDRLAAVRSELTVAINKAFHDAGIRLPFPQSEVHVHWPEDAPVDSAATPLSTHGHG